jgi:hypothetical protein
VGETHAAPPPPPLPPAAPRASPPPPPPEPPLSAPPRLPTPWRGPAGGYAAYKGIPRSVEFVVRGYNGEPNRMNLPPTFFSHFTLYLAVAHSLPWQWSPSQPGSAPLACRRELSPQRQRMKDKRPSEQLTVNRSAPQGQEQTHLERECLLAPVRRVTERHRLLSRGHVRLRLRQPRRRVVQPPGHLQVLGRRVRRSISCRLHEPMRNPTGQKPP